MNKYDISWVLILLIILFLIILNNPKNDILNKNNIYGEWEGNYIKKEVLFIFLDDGTCKLSFKNSNSDSNLTYNGIFNIDMSKTPNTLSIKKIEELNYPLFTVIEFLTIDSIKIGNFSPKWRLSPISFNKKHSIILNRKKKKNSINQ
jgi:hypothetical protein